MFEDLFSDLKDAVREAWSKVIPPDPATDRPHDPSITPGIRTSKDSAPTVAAKAGLQTSALARAKRHSEDKQLSKDLALTTAALGLTTAGAVVAHPLALLSLPLLIKLGIPFWRDGYHSLVKKRQIDRAVFDAVSTTVLLASGRFAITAILDGMIYLSRKLVLQTQNKSDQALIDVFGEQPRKVWIVASNGQEIEIPFEELKPGDQVIVAGGQRVPADGRITHGIATIDRRLLTGESQPVESGVGDPVFASTLVMSGQITVGVEKSGQETAAAQISEILLNTADYKSTVELWSHRFGNQAAMPQLALSAAALPVAGPQGALAVLVSDVAWDARVTGPLSVLNYLNLAKQHGILIKDGRALELLSKVNTVVFDKTGTLTLEQPELGRIYAHDGLDENQLLTYAASAEARQTHPIARAILHAAQARHLDLSASQNAHYQEGFGILVQLADKRVHVGSARYLGMEGIEIPAKWRALHEAGHEQGCSYVCIAVDNRFSGMIELRPVIRPEVKQLVHQLKMRGLKLHILSGDHEQVTAVLAQQLGIENYVAQVLPVEKADIVERLQADGGSVCFVGDGINDAIALKKAHVSVSLRGASTVATDVASMVLMDGNLEKMGRLFEIAKDLNTNLRRDMLASFVPGAASIAGVFFLHIGVLPAFVIGASGFAAGIVNAMSPRWTNGTENTEESKA